MRERSLASTPVDDDHGNMGRMDRTGRRDGRVPLHERLLMHIRGAPVQQILALTNQAEADGLEVTAAQLEAHYLAGGTPEPCLEALRTAHALGVQVDWSDVAMLGLAGRNPVELVMRAAVVHDRRLEPVDAACRDGSRVTVIPRARFRLPIVAIAWDQGEEILPWIRLRDRIGRAIETSASAADFGLRRDAQERSILRDARLALPSIQSVTLSIDSALDGVA